MSDYNQTKTTLRKKVLSSLAQAVFDQDMAITGIGISNRAKGKILRRIRRWLSRLENPLVTFELDGTEILIPLAHALPDYRKRFPHYSQNVARMAGYVKAKYSELTLVDIGANIGDSVVIIRNVIHCPILCIEGDARFFEFLEMNTAQFRDVYLEHSFVGTLTGIIRATIDSQKGTGHLVLTRDDVESFDEKVAVKTLSDILKSHPLFAEFTMLKIDTDGFDIAILRSELDLLRQRKPVIFFEYDPHFVDEHTPDGNRIFEELLSIGYKVAMVFENNGDYLCSVELTNQTLVEDIHEFYSGRASQRYCDICVFHTDDVDLWRMARQAEIEFFRSYRGISYRK